MLELAKLVYENIQDQDKLFKIFGENNISEVFLNCKDFKGKFSCRIDRYFNWGYTGDMEYWYVAEKDKYQENHFKLQPQDVVGISDVYILKDGIWNHFKMYKNNLKEVK